MPAPQSPGLFALADPQCVSQIVTAAGWAPPRFDRLDLALGIASDRGLDAAVRHLTQMGAVSSWLRDQPADVVATATAAIREALTPYLNGAGVRRPAAMWLVSSKPA